MSAHRATQTNQVIQNQSARLVLLGSIAPAGTATNFSLPAWSTESIQSVVGTSSQVPVPPGAQLWISSTADINVRLTAAGTGKGTGTVTYVTPSGAQTIVLGGRTVSFTALATATLTAALAVQMLMADSLIKNAFNVSNSAGVVTMSRLVGGDGGNVTLSATGTGATASGAALTGGTNTTAATTTANGFIVPAKLPFPIYKVAGDDCVDVIGTATVNIFVGV